MSDVERQLRSLRKIEDHLSDIAATLNAMWIMFWVGVGIAALVACLGF